MKALIPLISDSERKIVVLSAMSGTTNNLVEIAKFIAAEDITGATKLIEEMRSKYHNVVKELYNSGAIRKTGDELVDAHFDHITGFTLKAFTKSQEKAILAQGELMSTALFHLLLQERKIKSILLPALNFMRIDKYGEPDMFYIEENLKRELENHPDEQLFVTQGFICRDGYGEIDNLKRGGGDFTASLMGAAIVCSEIQIWTDINGFHNNDPRSCTLPLLTLLKKRISRSDLRILWNRMTPELLSLPRVNYLITRPSQQKME